MQSKILVVLAVADRQRKLRRGNLLWKSRIMEKRQISSFKHLKQFLTILKLSIIRGPIINYVFTVALFSEISERYFQWCHTTTFWRCPSPNMQDLVTNIKTHTVPTTSFTWEQGNFIRFRNQCVYYIYKDTSHFLFI